MRSACLRPLVRAPLWRPLGVAGGAGLAATRPPAATEPASGIRFEDRQLRSGITFVLANSTTPDKPIIGSVLGGVERCFSSAAPSRWRAGPGKPFTAARSEEARSARWADMDLERRERF